MSRYIRKEILFLLLLSGCSFFSAEEPSGEEAATELSSEALGEALIEDAARLEPLPDATVGETAIELVWEIPHTPVTKYYIYFGPSADALTLVKTVLVSDLDRFKHDAYGPVFRYILSGVGKKCGMYVSMQAENHAGQSPQTPPQQLLCK